ncbi:unnamed protein product [Sphenostylis stenocarpa]|uniref:Uncharacterized protein n=1 Tax=Sphenostylis stenocarpa TaxID=92480 RepID=A0AA86W3D3_9FABA|nr:unnamed protein product [Sphenostylis stenocarpa]
MELYTRDPLRNPKSDMVSDYTINSDVVGTELSTRMSAEIVPRNGNIETKLAMAI